MTSQPLDEQSLLELLQLESSKVKNIYVIGSRIFGTTNSNSDFDFILVADTEEPISRKLLHNIDATIMSVNEVKKRLSTTFFFYETILGFIPKQWTWRQEFDPKDTLREHFDPAVFGSTILVEAEKEWKAAREAFEKGNTTKGKKAIVHGFRKMLIATDIVHKARADKTFSFQVDLTNGIEYHKELQACTEIDWPHYHQKYSPIFSKLAEALKAECSL